MPRNAKIVKKVSYGTTRKTKQVKKSQNSPMSETKKALEAIEDNRRQIIEMQNKILSTPAMNGGFSTLMYKIEKIEQSQEHLVEKVDDIRDVLYDPDSGLYARIKSVENTAVDIENFEKLKEDIKEIKNWKTAEEKISEKEEQHDIDIEKILKDHADVIKELQSWYQKQAAVTKWLAITVGTALIGAAGKLLHIVLVNNVHLI